MTQLMTNQRNELLGSLHERLLPHFPKKHHSDLHTLIEGLFRHASMQDLNTYDMTDLAGLVVSVWRTLQHHERGQQEVSVFNPNVEEHEWQSAHTIVTLLYEDVPFLIDSVRLTLNRLGVNIHSIFHASLSVSRDKAGQLQSFGSTGQRELLLLIEIDRNTIESEREALSGELNSVVNDVKLVVDDFEPMLHKAEDTLKDLSTRKYPIEKDDLDEAKVFLEWMANGNFTFLAYDEYVVEQGVVKQVEGSALGLFRKTRKRREESVDEMSEQRRSHVFEQELLIFSKSGRRSTVHRPAYSDYVLVKNFNAKGEVIGGRRYLGLYTSNVYNGSPDNIPVVRKKIARVLEKSGFTEGGHNHKELSAILMTFPRDELIQSSVDTLLHMTLDVLAIQERKRIRLLLRKDIYGKFLNAIVYMPRDIFNSQLRQQVHDLLAEQFDIEGSDFTSFFSESVLARTRFVFKLKQPLEADPPTEVLERRIVTMARRWSDELHQTLLESFGEEKGNQLFKRYQNAFPASYQEQYSARVAVADIHRMEALYQPDADSLTLSFYRSMEPTGSELKLKIFNRGESLLLSDLIPVLENLGLKVIDEYPYEIISAEEDCTWIYDFSLLYEPDPELDPAKYRDEFSRAFINVWHGRAENDTYNQLILRAKLTWREVAMLRAYAHYMKQLRFGLSQEYIADTLIKYTDITDQLAELFSARFSPEKQKGKSQIDKWLESIEQLLEGVNNINEDRILRRYVELMKATLRTNFYQEEASGRRKDYIAFKFNPAKIKDIPLPRPKFEIFVYSPRVEGVHLRGGKVARGGLRWSDRIEDFRTEVLGLVKAQQVKNAVIVPVGAKGGFVAKRLPADADRETLQKEGVACYKIFIRALLDITDNLREGEVIPPKLVVRYDEDDPYLVVAADKGTATFSDIANEVADEFGFWLGDAFASGGSNGYDHKKMGITARGAWVSVQRHFRELGVDVQHDPITVIGIGDMAGDVFGNGMLLSQSIKLQAAFNHLHIFIDPNPDTQASYAERKRMFELPRSSWEDYNQALISKGGGIFSRHAKSIAVSKEMKAAFGIDKAKVTPNELISALLKSPVDLLWNGGIGTYVKASHETHADIGDKANDAVRVNANELRCKIIGEGGNLGFSQLARVEFNLGGGRCFTDFIDNAGGVDCSDHEVNMKILLDDLVANGDMTVKQRNQWLFKLTEDVSRLVLRNNYRQTQALGVAYTESLRRVEEYRRLINSMEIAGKLNRELEFLPNDEEISERKARGQGLTRPELSVLISYVKGDLKEQLIRTNVAEDAYLSEAVTSVFPQAMRKAFSEPMHQHRLKAEIVATQIANDIFNYMGITYFNRLQESTGASPVEAAKAYVAARDIFGLHDLWDELEALDYNVPAELQSSLMLRSARMVRRASRWLVKNYRTGIDIQTAITLYRKPIETMIAQLENLLPDEQKAKWLEEAEALEAQGVPQSVARRLSAADMLYTALGVIAVAQSQNRDPMVVLQGYFRVGDALELDSFSQQVNSLNVNSHWQAMARESFRDDLEWQQRRITQGLFAQLPDGQELDGFMDGWLERNTILVDRWLKMMSEIRAVNDPEFSMYSVAIRELLDLSQATMPEL
ncbi:MAG: NAD-glutamate dehydrogenase [Saccharospirillum sp.]